MDIRDIIIEMLGTDPRILDLSTILGCEPEGEPLHGHTEEEGDQYYASVRLDIPRSDPDEMLEAATDWLEANLAALQSFEGEKTLEIQTSFDGNGSDFLCLDDTLIHLAAQAGLQVHVQVSQKVSRWYYRWLRLRGWLSWYR